MAITSLLEKISLRKKSGNPEDGPEYHSFFDRNGYNSQTGMNLNDYVVPNDSSTGIGWSDGQ